MIPPPLTDQSEGVINFKLANLRKHIILNRRQPLVEEKMRVENGKEMIQQRRLSVEREPQVNQRWEGGKVYEGEGGKGIERGIEGGRGANKMHT